MNLTISLELLTFAAAKIYTMINNAFKGMAMGIAEVIPGVSGGTIAFITGIYERLINVIKSFGPNLIKEWREGGIAGLWKAIDGTFLFSLGAGMAVGVVVGVFAISHLIENYPTLVWGFFFGLIIASVIYIGRQIKQWSAVNIVALLLGLVIAYGITVLAPANGSESLLFVYISGVISISALILPGISGSFILLLMGMYTYIITDTIKPFLKTFAADKFLIIVVFALGCLTGLASISRLLSWLFKKHRDLTLAILTGFMLGSLNKIWPWRNPTEWLRDSTGAIIMDEDGVTPKKVLMEANVWPNNFDGDPYVIGTVALIIIGFLMVFVLERLGQQKEH